MENRDIAPESGKLDGLRGAADKVRAEIGRTIVGQEEMLDLLIAALLSDGHVLIEGVPGVAKTLSARLMARTVSVDFARLQFTPDLMPSDVIGTSVFNPQSGNFEFRHGPVFANIVLVDEINRAPAKTQSALFEAMEERQISVDGKTYPLQAPFMVVATQNPVEHEGTYRLPEAQLDRFLFKIEVAYPSLEDEIRILANNNKPTAEPAGTLAEAVISAAELEHYRAQVRELHADARLLEYIAQIVHQSRTSPALYLGASPRASLAILAASKALAALAGRDFVIPEDIQRAAYPVLRHRIMLTPEKEMEGVNPDEVIRELIRKIEVPR